MGDELCLHFLATIGKEVLVAGSVWEFIDSLAGTTLYKVAGESF